MWQFALFLFPLITLAQLDNKYSRLRPLPETSFGGGPLVLKLNNLEIPTINHGRGFIYVNGRPYPSSGNLAFLKEGVGFYAKWDKSPSLEGLVEINLDTCVNTSSVENNMHCVSKSSTNVRVERVYFGERYSLTPAYIGTHLGAHVELLERVYFTEEEEEIHNQRSDLLPKMSLGASFILTNDLTFPRAVYEEIRERGKVIWTWRELFIFNGGIYQFLGRPDHYTKKVRAINVVSGEVSKVIAPKTPFCTFLPTGINGQKEIAAGKIFKAKKVSSERNHSMIVFMEEENPEPYYPEAPKLRCHRPVGTLPLTAKDIERMSGETLKFSPAL